jgi:predicted transglutaminase-like cysteine proteinase
MARLLFGIVVVAALSLSFVAMSRNAASAQERATCSQARAHCGTQRVCQRRYEACMETGCWTVTLVRRCGYEKR